MQIYPDKLPDSLSRSLSSVYCVFGDEPYQKYQSLDAIRKQAQQRGFHERQSFVADQAFNWEQLNEATQSLSLFSQQQLIELELPTGKPGKEGGKYLVDIAATLTDDTLLILHGPRIGKDVQNSKWFKAINQRGSYIPCFPLEGQALLNWLRNLANNKQCQLDNDALALLTEYSEGNMLAGAQEIEKLVLNFPDQLITLKDIERVVVNQSRFNVFQLVDALLAGNSKKTTKLLHSLESEGLEPAIILWALVKEWQTLIELKSIHGAINWNQFRIWGAKKNYYESALSRVSLHDLQVIGEKLVYADSVFKQQTITRPYIVLCHLCLLFVFPSLHHFDWEV